VTLLPGRSPRSLLLAGLLAGLLVLPASGDEPPPREEPAATDAAPPPEEATSSDATPPADEPPASDATPPADEPGTGVEPPPGGEPVPAVQVNFAGPQLLVEDLRPGVGAEASFGMALAVHYTGWLYEPNALGYRGRQFDSSRERATPFVFMLGGGRVIKGWDLGLGGLRVGGLRRLVIPPELAYGDREVGDGLIPAGSTLVFEVELLGIESTSLTENTR
jgi:FKBP-type peptidyl-prolyl cis-trans isomerase FkpA